MHAETVRKELRKVLIVSALALVLCVACLVSVTTALFVIEVDSGENTVTVAEITGSIVGMMSAFGEETEAETKAITWEGTAPGYCTFTLTGSEAGPVTYYMERPASALPVWDEQQAQWVQDTEYSLFHVTFNEPGTALGDYAYSWGEPPAGAIALSPNESIEYGTKFVTNTMIGVGTMTETSQRLPFGTYNVTIDWSESTTTGHCTLILTDEKGKDPTAVYYLICPLYSAERRTTFELQLNVDTIVEIIPQRGLPDVTGAGLESHITYGTPPKFIADISVADRFFHVENEAEQTDKLEAGMLEAGEYTLFVNWAEATAPGYCTVVLDADVGDDPTTTYYLACPEGDERSLKLDLKLDVDTKVTVNTYKGDLPQGAAVAPKSVKYGTAVFKAAFAVDGAEPSAESYDVGGYSIAIDWSAATASGYCVFVVTATDGSGETAFYGVSCPKGVVKTDEISINLLRPATIMMETGLGKLPADVTPLTTGAATFGADFRAEAAVDGTPLGEEAYAAGEYTLSLDWNGSTVNGVCKLTLTAEDGSSREVYSLPASRTEPGKSAALTLVLHTDTYVKLETAMGSLPAGTDTLAPGDTVTFGTPASSSESPAGSGTADGEGSSNGQTQNSETTTPENQQEGGTDPVLPENEG